MTEEKNNEEAKKFKKGETVQVNYFGNHVRGQIRSKVPDSHDSWIVQIVVFGIEEIYPEIGIKKIKQEPQKDAVEEANSPKSEPPRPIEQITEILEERKSAENERNASTVPSASSRILKKGDIVMFKPISDSEREIHGELMTKAGNTWRVKELEYINDKMGKMNSNCCGIYYIDENKISPKGEPSRPIEQVERLIRHTEEKSDEKSGNSAHYAEPSKFAEGMRVKFYYVERRVAFQEQLEGKQRENTGRMVVGEIVSEASHFNRTYKSKVKNKKWKIRFVDNKKREVTKRIGEEHIKVLFKERERVRFHNKDNREVRGEIIKETEKGSRKWKIFFVDFEDSLEIPHEVIVHEDDILPQ